MRVCPENHSEVQQEIETESGGGGAPTDNQLASRGSHCPLQGNCRCKTPSKVRILEKQQPPEKQPPPPPPKCSLGKLVIANDISTMQRPPEPNYKGASQVTPFLPLLSPLLQPCRDQPEQVVEEGKDGDRKTISQVIFLLVSRPRKASANGTGRI